LKACFASFPSDYDRNHYQYESLGYYWNKGNQSIVKIFPSEKQYIKYIYSQKMDFDQLIYQIGGIIGLWFGYSALSLMHLLIEISKK